MIPLLMTLVLCTGVSTVESQIHSVMFEYTYMSNPPNGIPILYTERHFDGVVVASFNSSTNTSHPEVEWIRSNANLWMRSSDDKYEWFARNTQVLIERKKLLSEDNHVLEWTHGCIASRNSEGELVFEGLQDNMVFNKEHLLSLDYKKKAFVGYGRDGVGTDIAEKWHVYYRHIRYFKEKCTLFIKELLEQRDAYTEM